MKKIWDKTGHLTEFGKTVTKKAEQKIGQFLHATGAKGREILDVELVILRATAYVGTMARLRAQAK